MTDLMSDEAMDSLLFLVIPLGSDRGNGRKKIRAAYAAALAERDALAAELEKAKERAALWCNDAAIQNLRAEQAEAELAELRAEIAQVAMLLDQKPSLFHQSLSNRLRALDSQPQGERGKAILAVVENVRRVTVGGPPDGCGLCQRGTCRAPAHNALTARLAAIDGAQALQKGGGA